MMEQVKSDTSAVMTAQTALAQMAARHRVAAAEQVAGFHAALRSAFARMSNDWPLLGAQVADVSHRALSVAEVADLIEPGMFVAMLDNATDDLGVTLICPNLTGALVDGVTTGRVMAPPMAPRAPTRTDAALLAPMIDVLLRQISERCAAHPMGQRLRGFVYGSFMQDPRPLSLLLEDGQYRLVSFAVSLGQGSVQGTWSLILPAEPDPQNRATPDHAMAEHRAWAQNLQAAVGASAVQLDVTLFRAQLALSTAMSLEPGDMLCIPVNALETLSLRTLDGTELGAGRLGQARGQRAVRLTRDFGTVTAQDGASIPRAASMTPVIRGVDAVVNRTDGS
jgi:flagellar motor switch protein FliM